MSFIYSRYYIRILKVYRKYRVNNKIGREKSKKTLHIWKSTSRSKETSNCSDTSAGWKIVWYSRVQYHGVMNPERTDFLTAILIFRTVTVYAWKIVFVPRTSFGRRPSDAAAYACRHCQKGSPGQQQQQQQVSSAKTPPCHATLEWVSVKGLTSSSTHNRSFWR